MEGRPRRTFKRLTALHHPHAVNVRALSDLGPIEAPPSRCGSGLLTPHLLEMRDAGREPRLCS
jgi:hypothetical protein